MAKRAQMLNKMAFIKVVSCVVLLAALATATVVQVAEKKATDPHNLVQCKEPVGTDWVILHRDTVMLPGKLLQIVEEDLVYPEDGVGSHKLTCIRVTDKIGHGSGGFPKILTGGVDFNHVTLRFTSQRSRGFEFFVEIWGEP